MTKKEKKKSKIQKEQDKIKSTKRAHDKNEKTQCKEKEQSLSAVCLSKCFYNFK